MRRGRVHATRCPARLRSARLANTVGGVLQLNPSGTRGRFRFARLALIALVALVGLGLLLGWGGDARLLFERATSLLRAAGPLVFFGVMAIAPAPLAWFTLPAGEAFAATLTLPGVVAAALLAVAIQLSLYYWIARSVFRPGLHRWLTRRGHVVPTIPARDALAAVLLVRLIPGPPMSIGSCLLGVAEAPFRVYLLASWLVAVPWVIGGIVLGRGLLGGNLTFAASGIGVLVAATLALQIARRRLVRRANGNA